MRKGFKKKKKNAKGVFCWPKDAEFLLINHWHHCKCPQCCKCWTGRSIRTEECLPWLSVSMWTSSLSSDITTCVEMLLTVNESGPTSTKTYGSSPGTGKLAPRRVPLAGLPVAAVTAAPNDDSWEGEDWNVKAGRGTAVEDTVVDCGTDCDVAVWLGAAFPPWF